MKNRAYYETLAGCLEWRMAIVLPRAVYNGYTICKHDEQDYHIARYDHSHLFGGVVDSGEQEVNLRSLPEILYQIDNGA